MGFPMSGMTYVENPSPKPWGFLCAQSRVGLFPIAHAVTMRLNLHVASPRGRWRLTLRVEIRMKTEGDNTPPSSLPAVAVIMRSKDEEPHATATLRELFKQSFTRFTLYNVDSGSTDGTWETIERMNSEPANIKQIPPGDYVPGRVLNDMIRSVSEPIIVLLNADCIPESTSSLGNLLAPIFADEADAVTGKQTARDNARFIVEYDLQRVYGDAPVSHSDEAVFSAAASAFKRSVWESEPFPEEGWGEDFVWASRCRAKGYRFVYEPDACFEHSHNYSLKTLYRRERGHGIVYFDVHGKKPSLTRQIAQCLKHVVRDTFHAIAHLEILSIPYNVIYRVVYHCAVYSGMSAGYRRQGFPGEFFRD